MSVDGNVVYTAPGGTPFDSVAFDLGHWSARPGFTTYFTNFSFSGDPAPNLLLRCYLCSGVLSLVLWMLTVIVVVLVATVGWAWWLE
jgi:hypothetical protein